MSSLSIQCAVFFMVISSLPPFISFCIMCAIEIDLLKSVSVVCAAVPVFVSNRVLV